jgi:membrane protease YdiL (CAAX protease family)
MRKLFGERLHLDWKIALLTIVSTLALLVDLYHTSLLPWSKWFPAWDATGLSIKLLDRTLLYFIIPMTIVLVIFRENPRDYGFTLGNWKAGFLITLVAVILLAPILWFVGRGDTAIHVFYKPMAFGLPWNTLLDLFSWEFMFRGWLLFGYGRKFGADALWLQAVPFALAHIGKPELETLSTIFGGFAFGWVAWRTRSFVYPLLIHWFVASFIIVISAGLIG